MGAGGVEKPPGARLGVSKPGLVANQRLRGSSHLGYRGFHGAHGDPWNVPPNTWGCQNPNFFQMAMNMAYFIGG